jgi:hypothetical protein
MHPWMQRVRCCLLFSKKKGKCTPNKCLLMFRTMYYVNRYETGQTRTMCIIVSMFFYSAWSSRIWYRKIAKTYRIIDFFPTISSGETRRFSQFFLAFWSLKFKVKSCSPYSMGWDRQHGHRIGRKKCFLVKSEIKKTSTLSRQKLLYLTAFCTFSLISSHLQDPVFPRKPQLNPTASISGA